MEKNKIYKIKSNLIVKNILSLVLECTKLNLIKYNQNFQNKLKISIENYKKSSQRYKIGEKNGIGKEFDIDTNNLIFEGDYKNGKKNGQGIEYYNNKQKKFEGEYLNGKKI